MSKASLSVDPRYRKTRLVTGPSRLDYAGIANQEHALARQSGESMIEHAILAGKALVAAKAQVAHGEWLPWLAANFDGSESIAQRYMQIASNPARVRDLEEPSLRRALEAVSSGDPGSKRAAERVANRAAVAAMPEPTVAQEHYRTIVLDPPWDPADEGDVDQIGRAQPGYALMPIDEIAALPVGTWAHPDGCHLYLWITNRSLPKGFALLEAWGFRYITTLTWCKPSIGVGNYFRNNTEHVLFGVKGSLQLTEQDQGTWFQANRGLLGHSSKPPEFFEIVRRVSPPPRLSYFERSERDGFVVAGAEAPAA